MRFGYCLTVSLVLHVAVLGAVRIRAARDLAADASVEPAPVTVHVLAEAPIIEDTAPEDLPAGPIFAPSAETQAIRRGMGALRPEPATRQPGERPSETRGPEPAPGAGTASPDSPAGPSEPDPFDWSSTAPSERGPDPRASEAPGGSADAPDSARLVPDAPAQPDHATPAAPPGDAGVGAGAGGSETTGAGPAPRGGGPGPAPAGEGDGRSGQGTGGEGTGGQPSGTSSDGGGGGQGGGGAAKPAEPAPKPKAKPKQAAHTPPYPRSREMQRLEIHGSVRLRLSVDESGSVTDASVVSPSGYPEYDNQVAYWVQSHWRYPEGHPGARTVSVSF